MTAGASAAVSLLVFSGRDWYFSQLCSQPNSATIRRSMLPESLSNRNGVDAAFHLKCPVPACMSSEADLFVRSASIVTFRCTTCGFSWSARIADLPPSVRRGLDALPFAPAYRTEPPV